MRWVFLLLLLLNGVLYAWFLQEQQERERSKARAQPDHSGLAPLVRLAEVPREQLQRRALESPAEPVTASAPKAGPAAPVSTFCYRVGLFADASTAQAFLETLSTLPVEAIVTSRRRPLAPDYWVYIIAPSSPREAAQLQRALKADGLDSYMVQQGPLTGQLSVGLYRSEESAQAVLAALRAKDYPAKSYLKHRWEQAYAVDLKTENSQQWEAYWARIRDGVNPGLESEKKSCTRVATDEVAE